MEEITKKDNRSPETLMFCGSRPYDWSMTESFRDTRSTAGGARRAMPSKRVVVEGRPAKKKEVRTIKKHRSDVDTVAATFLGATK